jgi:hypothetical protein
VSEPTHGERAWIDVWQSHPAWRVDFGGPGVDLLPIEHGAGVRVEIADDAADGAGRADPRIDEIWNQRLAMNPKLFDGAMLDLRQIEPRAGVFRCARASYRSLIASEVLGVGACLFAVVGVVQRRERNGASASVLLGRRGANVRAYGGLWECAPAGGVEPPASGVNELHADALIEQVREESYEELGRALGALIDFDSARILAAVRNVHARSLDVVVGLNAAAESGADANAGPTPVNWEYQSLRWVEASRALAEDAERPMLVPQTRAILRWLQG